MPEPWASCAECSTRYDTRLTAFCPRCGSTRRGAGPVAPPTAGVPGSDPSRRRAQIGGVLFAALALVLLLGTAGAWLKMDEVLAQGVAVAAQTDSPGGELHLRVLVDGAPVAAQVQLSHLQNGTALAFMNGTSDAHGWFNHTLEHMAGRLEATYGNRTASRDFVVFKGLAVTSTLELSEPAGAAIGSPEIMRYTRILLGAVAVAAALLLVAGIAAITLRWYPLAVAGAIPLLIATLMLTVSTLSIGMVAVFALQGLAVWMVVSGKRSFHR